MQATPRFRHSRLRVCAALVLAAALSLLVAPAAHAQSPFETLHPITLSFGASYGDPPRTHSGADVAGAAGDSVLAPVSGSVTFVGLVPAGEGARATAVTIQTADGDKVTLLPFEDIRCSRGARADAGDELGTLAGSGDVSSASTHLHLSLRRGTLYVDPAPLLVAAAPAPVPSTPPPATAGAPGPQASPTLLPVPSTAVQMPSVPSLSVPRTKQSPQSQSAASPAGALAPESAPGAQSQTPALVIGMPAGAPVAQAAPLSAGASALASRLQAATGGFDAVAAVKRMSALGASVARRHAKALVLGVAALVAGLAAFLNIERTARQLSESARNVGPEGDCVVSTQVRC